MRRAGDQGAEGGRVQSGGDHLANRVVKRGYLTSLLPRKVAWTTSPAGCWSLSTWPSRWLPRPVCIAAPVLDRIAVSEQPGVCGPNTVVVKSGAAVVTRAGQI